MILVTGFGSFPGVELNPTESIARALSGRRVNGHTVLSRVLPVAYGRGLRELVETAAMLRPACVVGLGVATQRSVVNVECTARRACGNSPDVDGVIRETVGPGPASVRATLDPRPFVRALDGRLSNDAGHYVCNAWLYTAVTQVSAPSIFLHVPPSGLDPDRLCAALSAVSRPQ